MFGMSSRPPVARPTMSVDTTQRRDRRSWWFGYGVCLVATLAIAVLAAHAVPQAFPLMLVLLVIVVAVAIIRPVIGVYLVVFFAVLGDPMTLGWYPFTKDFSSQESILFINHGIKFSPLELCLVALLIGWLLKMMASRDWVVRKGRLFGPMLVFTFFVLFGLAHGLASGGDRNIAFWELRPLLYLPLLYLLLTNLFDRRDQYVRMYALVMVAVFVNSVVALINYQGLTSAEKEGLESFVSHGATLPMNAMLILFVGAWMFRKSSWAWRALLPFALVPVTYMYLVSQRRAAFVALLGAVGIIAVVLFWTNRRAFLRVAPVILILGTLYTAAFWHDQTGSAGFPAQAVKSVIAPNEVSDRNQNSDFYRLVEKADILATIRSSPITGIGFGKPFLRPYPLPAINQFLLEPYMPHNSILWIWMKTGIGGFVAMVYLFGVAMHTGARSILRAGRGDYAATMLVSTTFVMMYAIFAYVDIAWDGQNIVLLALAMAQLAAGPRMKALGETETSAAEPHDAEPKSAGPPALVTMQFSHAH
jgi:O-antigen ligase